MIRYKIVSGMSVDFHKNPQELALRLDSMEEEEVRRVYCDLLYKLEAKMPEETLDEQRLINIYTSPISNRYDVIKSILGSNAESLSKILQDERAHRPILGRNLYIRCSKGLSRNIYFVRYPGTKPRKIDEDEAIKVATDETHLVGYDLIIEIDIPGIADGWEVCLGQQLDTPKLREKFGQTNPSKPALDIYHFVEPSNFDNVYLETQLNQGGITTTKLVVFDKCSDPLEGKYRGVDCILISDLTKNLDILTQQSEYLLRPSKRRMITAILLFMWSSIRIMEQKRSETELDLRLRSVLDHAELAWEKMFIEQRQLSDIQLNSRASAHTFMKTRMIFKGEREAQITTYLHDILFPLVRNFARKQELKLSELCRESKESYRFDLLHENGFSKVKSDLAAGAILAMPSAALLIPQMMELEEAIGRLITSEVSFTKMEREDINLGSFIKGFLPGLENAFNTINDTLVEGFNMLGERVAKLTQAVGTLTGVVLCGAVGAALAATIQTIVAIKGSLSLSQAQQLLRTSLLEVQNEWPQLREHLVSLIPTLKGESSEGLCLRAENVLKLIDERLIDKA